MTISRDTKVFIIGAAVSAAVLYVYSFVQHIIFRLDRIEAFLAAVSGQR